MDVFMRTGERRGGISSAKELCGALRDDIINFDELT
jgi:hypothetical protein